MSMKKFFFIFLSAVILTLTGCTAKRSDPNEITVWHWMTDRHKAFEELAKKYHEETGIKVKFELYAPADTYTHKIIASAQARVLPDIYGILDKKEIFASFIQNGFVADLTEKFKENNQEWEKSFFAKALDVNRFSEGNIYKVKPGIYGVPIDVTNIQMVYNKKMLAKIGVKNPPKTFEEFLSMAQALRRIGYSGMVAGWGALWMIDCFASNYAFNIMGEEKIMATFRGEVPYTDPDWIKVFDVFSQLSKKGALAEGVVGKPNKFAEQDFALERAAFAFNGSWCVNVYHDMNPRLDYGVMLPPAIGTKFPMKIWGGAGSSFVVNKRSSHRDEAVAFLKWLTAKDQQHFLAEATKNLPSNRQALSSIPQVLSEFAQGMDFTTHPTIWPYNESAVVTEQYARGIQSIIMGEKTPQQVAQEVQRIKNQEMEKTKHH